MTNPPLTIAVLTYNRSYYLSLMLDSIMRQTYKNFKVKIYDNASTDDTGDVIKKYLSDERFSYFRNDEQRNNWIVAINECDTDFLLVTHDDDIMHEEMIEEQMSVFAKDVAINLVSVQADTIDENGNKIDISDINFQDSFWVYNKYEFIEKYIDGFEKGVNICCPTTMVRISVLQKNKILPRLNVGKAMDTVFWFEINCLDGKLVTINKKLYHYRKHGGQDSVNWIYMLPLLRNPVYKLLLSNGKDDLAKKWVDFITKYAMGAICSTLYKKSDLQLLNDCVVLYKTFDIKIRFYIMVYVKLGGKYITVFSHLKNIGNKFLFVFSHTPIETIKKIKSKIKLRSKIRNK